MKSCRIMLLLPAICLTLALSACARAGEANAEDRFLLYYPAADLNMVTGGDAVVTREITVAGASALTTQELAERLMEALLAGPADAAASAPAPAGTSVQELSVFGKWARVDFSRQYARLAGIDLTLADYCVTLTLTQLDGVNAVSITSGGRELPYRHTQVFTAADPLLSTQESALRPVTVSLYFLDKTTGELRAERQALALYEGQTRVNALLEALLRGPESDDLQPLLPDGFVVLSARVEGGTCYLNLPADTDFGPTPDLALRSLVRSLCSLDNVDRVQLAADGEIVPFLAGLEVGGLLTP